MFKIPVRRARQSPLTDFSPRIGPFLVRLTLEKWALSRLTMILHRDVNVNDSNETYRVKKNHVFSVKQLLPSNRLLLYCMLLIQHWHIFLL